MTIPADLEDHLLALGATERAHLAAVLLDSLDETEAGADDAWADELAARLRALDAGEAETFDAAEVVRDVRAELAPRRG